MKNLIEQLQGKYVYANSDEEGAEIVRLMVKAGGDNHFVFTGKANNIYYLDENGRISSEFSMVKVNLTISELRDLVEPKEVQYFNPPVDMEVSNNGEGWKRAYVRFIEPDGTTWEVVYEKLFPWKRSRPIPFETLTISEAEKQLSEFKNCNVKIK